MKGRRIKVQYKPSNVGAENEPNSSSQIDFKQIWAIALRGGGNFAEQVFG